MEMSDLFHAPAFLARKIISDSHQIGDYRVQDTSLPNAVEDRGLACPYRESNPCSTIVRSAT
jgi:hypothetical protein